jgi:CheY-like chemotaxis protein
MNRVFGSAHDSVPGDVPLPGRGAHAAGYPGRVAVNVLCVDDDARFRAVLRTLVTSIAGFVQIGEAGSGEDAIAAVEATRTDLVLMDVQMPGIDGFDAAAAMVERHPKLVGVLLSASQVEPPLPLTRLSPDVTFMVKEDLSPRRLLDLWNRRRKLSGC